MPSLSPSPSFVRRFMDFAAPGTWIPEKALNRIILQPREILVNLMASDCQELDVHAKQKYCLEPGSEGHLGSQTVAMV